MGVNDNRPDSYYIPDNLNDRRKFFHIPDRNLMETVVAEIILYNIMKTVPLPAIPKLVTGFIVLGIAGATGIIGIKNESVTEFIASTVKFQKKKRTMHYRRCDQRNYDGDDEADYQGPGTKAGELIRRFENAAIDRVEERIRAKGEREGKEYGASPDKENSKKQDTKG